MSRSRKPALVFCFTSLLAAAMSLAPVPPAWAGAGWKVAVVPAQTGVLGSVSCPSATDCWASDGSLIHSTNGGRTWTAVALGEPNAGNNFSQISCPSTSDCWIAQGSSAGSGAPPFEHTTTGGASWSAVAVPSGIADFAAISCPSTSTCYAAGQASTKHRPAVGVTRNDGKSWAVASLSKPASRGDSFDAITCSTTKDCLVGGSGPLLRTTNGGKTWTKAIALTDNFDVRSISCGSKKSCTAVGAVAKHGTLTAVLLHTADGGKKWSEPAAPKGPNHLEGVTCYGTADCWAVGSKINKDFENTKTYVIATTDSGKKWTTQTSYAVKSTSGGFLNAIDCPTKTHCAAVGRADAVQTSFAIYTTTGG